MRTRTSTHGTASGRWCETCAARFLSICVAISAEFSELQAEDCDYAWRKALLQSSVATVSQPANPL